MRGVLIARRQPKTLLLPPKLGRGVNDVQVSQKTMVRVLEEFC